MKEFGASRVAAIGKKLEEGLIETGRVIDKGVTSVRQGASDVFGPQMVTPDGSIFRKTVDNNHAVENFMKSQMDDFKGFFGRGSNSALTEIDGFKVINGKVGGKIATDISPKQLKMIGLE